MTSLANRNPIKGALILAVVAGGCALLFAFGTDPGRLERGVRRWLTVATGASVPALQVPPQQPLQVTFTLSPASTYPISRYIYGANLLTDDGDNGVVAWAGAQFPDGMTLNRMGGNRLSAYNWQLNASNAGKDLKFQNDRYLNPSPTAGEAVKTRMSATVRRGAAMLVTIPMLPFVAGNADGVELDTLEITSAQRLGRHFVPNRPSRGPADQPRTVYQDDFVRWLTQAFPALRTGASPAMFSLDNEPDAWHDTHLAIMPPIGGKPAIQTYDGFVQTSLDYARMVKDVLPQSIVFGPAFATYTGYLTMGRYPAPDPRQGRRPFVEYYLERFQTAEKREGRRLLDVLDLHWYPATGTRNGEITNDWAPQNPEMINARLQSPRSLWDATYDERSWVSQTAGGPIALLPTLRTLIARYYPGTKIAITEYFYGRAGDISGGLTQADVLGIFGREGVYAAALWPQAGIWAPPYTGSGAKAYAYALGAFRLFRNYDGKGSTFGDTGVRARTSDPVNTSVYASRDALGRIVLVAINKTESKVTAQLALPGLPVVSASMWTLRQDAPVPVRQPDLTSPGGAALAIVLPPMSASTVVLRNAPAAPTR